MKVQFMGHNNTVRVTREDHKDIDRIGIINAHLHNDFVIVDFGTHSTKHNINSLLDLTYKFADDAGLV